MGPCVRSISPGHYGKVFQQSPVKHEITKLISHLSSYHRGKPSRPQLNHKVADGFKPILATTQYTGIEKPLRRMISLRMRLAKYQRYKFHQGCATLIVEANAGSKLKVNPNSDTQCDMQRNLVLRQSLE